MTREINSVHDFLVVVENATKGPIWLNYGNAVRGPYHPNEYVGAAHAFFNAPNPNGVGVEDEDGTEIIYNPPDPDPNNEDYE